MMLSLPVSEIYTLIYCIECILHFYPIKTDKYCVTFSLNNDNGRSFNSWTKQRTICTVTIYSYCDMLKNTAQYIWDLTLCKKCKMMALGWGKLTQTLKTPFTRGIELLQRHKKYKCGQWIIFFKENFLLSGL